MINAENEFDRKFIVQFASLFALLAAVPSVGGAASVVPSHPCRLHNLKDFKTHATAATSDFCHLVTDGVYVDKTGIVKDFLDRCDFVARIIRPRGWGKSTNLDTIRRFLEMEVDQNGNPIPACSNGNVSASDAAGACLNRKLFAGGEVEIGASKSKQLKPLEVSRSVEVMKRQGQYPVVLVELKNVMGSSAEEIENGFRKVIAGIFRQRNYLRAGLSKADLEKFDAYSTAVKSPGAPPLERSLRFIRDLLHQRYNRSVSILVDDYDTPLNSLFFSLVQKEKSKFGDLASEDAFNRAYATDDFWRTFAFFRTLYEQCLLDGAVLNNLLLTGIFHISFTEEPGALNSIVNYSIQDRDLANYYGFSHREVEWLLARVPYRIDQHIEQLARWYSYDFGGRKLYNPWSVKHFLANRGWFGSYWIDEGLVNDILKQESMQEPLLLWLEGKTVGEWIAEDILYQNMSDWSFSYLLFSGYLSPSSVGTGSMGLTVPNLEVRENLEAKYATVVREKFGMTSDDFIEVANSLFSYKFEAFGNKLKKLMEHVKPVPAPVFYRGFMKCLTFYFEDDYTVQVGVESDSERPDIMMISKFGRRQCFIAIDYEVIENDSSTDLSNRVESGFTCVKSKVAQMNVRKQFNDIKRILQVILVFRGNEVGFKFDYVEDTA